MHGILVQAQLLRDVVWPAVTKLNPEILGLA